MKICVMGFSGSGKSTLSRKLGQYYHIDVLHLDKVHHLPGWQERDEESEKKMVYDFLNEHDNWIIDGNYSSILLNERLEQADKIIILHFHRLSCLCRVIKRYFQNRGQSRIDMCEGCLEKIDIEFIWWILYAGRKKDMYQKICQSYQNKVIVLKNQKDLDLFEKNI
ncbi:MAG: hypothetical protein ACI4SR_05765 [Faecalibacillus sp.]